MLVASLAFLYLIAKRGGCSGTLWESGSRSIQGTSGLPAPQSDCAQAMPPSKQSHRTWVTRQPVTSPEASKSCFSSLPWSFAESGALRKLQHEAFEQACDESK